MLRAWLRGSAEERALMPQDSRRWPRDYGAMAARMPAGMARGIPPPPWRGIAFRGCGIPVREDGTPRTRARLPTAHRLPRPHAPTARTIRVTLRFSRSP